MIFLIKSIRNPKIKNNPKSKPYQPFEHYRFTSSTINTLPGGLAPSFSSSSSLLSYQCHMSFPRLRSLSASGGRSGIWRWHDSGSGPASFCFLLWLSHSLSSLMAAVRRREGGDCGGEKEGRGFVFGLVVEKSRM